MNANTPPGWFPDSERQGILRYWDGRAWTEHTAPMGAPLPGPTLGHSSVSASKPNTTRNLLIGGGVLVVLLILGAFVGGLETTSTTSTSGGTATMEDVEANSDASESEPEESEPEPEEPTGSVIEKSDVLLSLRETSKQCFGSAGCSLEYKVEPQLAAGIDPSNLASDYEVTYEVRGDSSGPIVSSFVLYADGTYDVPDEGFADTASSSVKLKPVVTRIDDVGVN